ncbi:MAG TPA: hypothetical protein VNZ86_04650 [Bacteroidia bacterium]|jgi:hypothetical protein|nr:hypothetical protein [Bacteroidia bacterium]
MKQALILFVCFMLFFSLKGSCHDRTPFDCAQGDKLYVMSSEVETYSKPGPLKEHQFRLLLNRKRFIAAVLAFPLPTGFLGAHRIFLGTNPYIPVTYVATLGGCLGIIPTIDFFVILFAKDLDKYTDNPHVFMWLK